MSTARRLIVNADDFGASPGVNRGIIEAHQRGLVTSASLMVRWPGAEEAAAYGRRNTQLSVGLHIDLGEWVYRDDAWVEVYQVVPSGDPSAIAAEVEAQLATFRALVGDDPTHLDSHQHVHRSEPVRSILSPLAAALGVPLRDVTPGLRYCGDFYGQTDKGDAYPEGIAIDRLVGLIGGLASGTTELGCHPGFATDLDSVYQAERAAEVATLCDPRAREALAAARVELCSFRDFRQSSALPTASTGR